MNPDDAATDATSEARRWLRRHSFDRIEMASRRVRDRFAGRPGAVPISLSVLQILLKHRELAGDMVTAFGRQHHTTTAALARPLLEGSLALQWAALGDAESQYRRLLRLAATTTPRARSEAPDRDIVAEEIAALKLKNLPKVKHLADALDRHAELRGADAPAQQISGTQRYDHYGLLSEYSHATAAGPAAFSTDDGDLVVWPRAQGLDGAGALHLGMLYAAEAYLAVCTLADLPGEIGWALETYGPVFAATERALGVAMGRFPADSDLLA